MLTNFYEWMSFRQSVEAPEGDYDFIGTYNNDQFPNLKETSQRIELDDALSLIPKSYQNQFSNMETIHAGKSQNESNKDVIWISNQDQNITFLFEKR